MKRIYLMVFSLSIIKYLLYSVLLLALLINFNLHKGRYLHIFRPTYDVNLENQNNKGQGKIAIVIDDFGFDGLGTKEMLAIGIPLTCAVLPFSDYTKEDSEKIHQLGHEIILHLPMEPHHGDPKWLGENGITDKLSNEEIEMIVRNALDEVPYAVGVNNHMGSKATENQRIVETIVLVLEEKKVYILDSKTTMKSVIENIAASHDVPYISRTLFLDNVKDKTYIKKQLRKLGGLAIKNGSAVAIGHVGPEGGIVTANAIKEMVPELEAMGIEFVYLSQLLKEK